MTPRKAAVLGADTSLRALLEDVLGEVGVVLLPPGDCQGADLVLTQLSSEEQPAAGLVPPWPASLPPLVVLLPFADDLLRTQAVQMGARGCYAMGTPLALLRACVLEVVGAPAPGTPDIALREAA
jgi:hypothetical protein